MDEDPWRDGTDPLALLDVLYPQHTLGSPAVQTRKCRLYLVACARRHWDRLPGVCRGLVAVAEWVAEDARARSAVRAAAGRVAEQLLNSDGSEDDLAVAGTALDHQLRTFGPEVWDRYVAALAGGRAELAPDVSSDQWAGLAALTYLPFAPETPPFAWAPRELHSAALVRDIYYHPHAFLPFSPDWRTSTVVALARRVYDEREFSAMPILADALQDAGCDSEAILAHCRDPHQEHVCGCWVLDRVLNRR